jgi:hypothetical protein
MLSRNEGRSIAGQASIKDTLPWMVSWLPPPDQAIQHSNSSLTNVCDGV